MANFAVCLVLLVLGSATAEKVSPVQKVIELLDQLKGKVEADLAAEATAMEEYSSWCDTEISDKGYAIKTATREIADHNAAISPGLYDAANGTSGTPPPPNSKMGGARRGCVCIGRAEPCSSSECDVRTHSRSTALNKADGINMIRREREE